MSFSLFNFLSRRFPRLWRLFLYAATWTAAMTVTVAAASFSPEAAFVWAISPSSSFSRGCEGEGAVRIPLDVAGEIVCLPAHMFARSKIDFIVPPVFAAVIVAASAWVVRAVGLPILS